MTWDGGKLLRGRKRGFAVDTQGWPHAIVVVPGGWSDLRAAQALLINLPDASADGSDSVILADKGFDRETVHGMAAAGGRTLHIGSMPGKPPQAPRADGPNKGFRLIPIRWVVERTNAWTSSCRRLSREHERTTYSHEAFAWLAALRLLLRRVARHED
jgi:transposase